VARRTLLLGFALAKSVGLVENHSQDGRGTATTPAGRLPSTTCTQRKMDRHLLHAKYGGDDVGKKSKTLKIPHVYLAKWVGQARYVYPTYMRID